MKHIFGICLIEGTLSSDERERFRMEHFEETAGLTCLPDCAAAVSGGTVIRWGNSLCQWNGRLDNRREVLHELGSETPARDRCDAEAALSAFSAGSQALGALIGDWSMAVIDAANRSVSLASDYSGVLPLYYAHLRKKVVWSSSLKWLADWTRQSALDREYAAEFIALGRANGKSPWKTISPVPPGAVVTVTASGVRREQFWCPPIDRKVVLAGEAEYAARLAELFREAVAVRLDPVGPTVAELSGGLDSTSIACQAHELIRSGAAPASRLMALTYKSRQSSDTAFVECVEASRQLPVQRVNLMEHGFASPETLDPGTPTWWGPRDREVLRLTAPHGCSTILTGQTGDLIMGNWFEGSEQVAHEVKESGFRAALGKALCWAQTQGQPVYTVLAGAGRTLFASPRDVVPTAKDLAAGSLVPRAARRVEDGERDRFRHGAWRFAPPGRRERMRALIDILDSRRLQSPDHLRPLTWSHPFAHRPLVEFMLSVPPAAVYGPGRPRELMRRSLEHLLPPAVASRRSKAGYRDIFRLSLLPMAAQLRESSSLILADEGLIDADHVRARMSRFVRGEECNESQLRHIILLEHWLRRRLQFPEQARHTVSPDSRASAEFRSSLALSGEVRLGKA